MRRPTRLTIGPRYSHLAVSLIALVAGWLVWLACPKWSQKPTTVRPSPRHKESHNGNSDPPHIASEANEQIRQARDYFDQHIARFQQIAQTAYPAALAKRAAAEPNLPALQAAIIGKELREYRRTHADLIQRYADQAAASHDQYAKISGGMEALRTAVAYSTALHDESKVGSMSVAEIARKAMQSPTVCKNLRAAAAKTERRIFNDEAAASRVEALPDGAPLADCLQDVESRYLAAGDRLEIGLGYDAEVRAHRRDFGYQEQVQNFCKTYVSTLSRDITAQEEEYSQLARAMFRSIQSMPQDTPEGRAMLTQFSEAAARMRQARDHFGLP